jgi:hypothetical protein
VDIETEIAGGNAGLARPDIGIRLSTGEGRGTNHAGKADDQRNQRISGHDGRRSGQQQRKNKHGVISAKGRAPVSPVDVGRLALGCLKHAADPRQLAIGSGCG